MIYNSGTVAIIHTAKLPTMGTKRTIRGWLLLVATLAGAAVSAAPAPPADFHALAARCAPGVHSSTLAAVVGHESGFNSLAIGVNGEPRVRVRAATINEAVEVASRLIRQGRSVDLGLGQINSQNLERLNLTVEQAFDPCRNLAAAGQVLTENYLRYRPTASSDQAALNAALSAYNTGNAQRGIRNGYVGKVRAAAGAVIPSLGAGVAPEAPQVQPAPAWDVFGSSSAGAFSQAGQGGGVLVFRRGP